MGIVGFVTSIFFRATTTQGDSLDVHICAFLGIPNCEGKKDSFGRSTSGARLPRGEGSDGSPPSQLDGAGFGHT